jgi:hypothetical protein
VAAGLARQHPVVGQAEDHLRERQSRPDQQHEHHRRDRQRPAHDGDGQAVPGPLLVGARTRLRAAQQPPRGAGEVQGVDPRPEHRERGRQHDDRADRGEHHGAHAGVGERAQEVQREHQQRSKADEHGDRGEQHGASGSAHRAHDGVVVGMAGPALLAVAAEHEQAVVDAQPEAERDGQVDRVDADVGDAAEQLQGQEGAEDRQHADQQREAGGHGAAEHQDQQHGGEREDDQLGPQQVALDGVADLAEDLDLPADVDAQAGDPAQGLSLEPGAELGHRGDLLVLVAGEAAEHERLAAVGAAQRGGAGGPVRGGLDDGRLRGQLLDEGPAGGSDSRVVDVAAGRGDQQQQVGGAGAELLLEHAGGGDRLGARVVEAPGREVRGDPAADRPGEREEGQGDEQDPPGSGEHTGGESEQHGNLRGRVNAGKLALLTRERKRLLAACLR